MNDASARQLTENSDAESAEEIEITGAAELSRIADRLDALEAQSAEFNRRSLHRETVIDRLHEENQKLRDEMRSSVFDPIAADLIRLYDGLHRDVERLASTGADPSLLRLLESYADDIELTLDRCGLESFSGKVGEPFRRGEHQVVDTVAAVQPDQSNVIAKVLAVGFRDRVTGRVKRPLRANFYRLDVSAEK
jgi:molecular chaperone GrpE (heat shock protein)